MKSVILFWFFENKEYSKKVFLFLQYSMIEGIFKKGSNIPCNIPILFSSCVVVLFHFKWHIVAGLPEPLEILKHLLCYMIL